MKNKKNQIELSYNMQLTVNYNSGIILANSVTQDPTDHHQLIPQIEQTIQTIGPLNKDTAINADNGYFTKTNLQYLDNNKLDGYIPNRKQAHKSKKNYKTDKPYSKHNFTYNYEKDFYLCPNNEKLKYKKTYNYNNINMRQYYTNKCLNCPNQLECAGKDRYKIITDYGDISSKRMASKMETDNGKI
jgi:transposase